MNTECYAQYHPVDHDQGEKKAVPCDFAVSGNTEDNPYGLYRLRKVLQPNMWNSGEYDLVYSFYYSVQRYGKGLFRRIEAPPGTEEKLKLINCEAIVGAG